MPGLELVPLESQEAAEFWKAFVAGRKDQPTDNFVTHLDRYLREPPEVQQTYFAFKENERIVGTVRIGSPIPNDPSNTLSFFSLVPDARGWTRDAILAAVDPMIGKGAQKVFAAFDDTYATDFAKLGFVERYSRMRMESPPLTKREPPAFPLAHPEALDVDDVAAFLMRAYEGHMEQQFGMHVGSVEEWDDYVTSIWKGETGAYLPLGSWLTRDEGGIVGVALASHWMGSPLLAEIGVRKDRRGQGVARGLIVATMNALVDLGYDRLALYVTIGNDPATHLYESLGFRNAGARNVNAVLEL
ncbi:MAG: GNAT family N-acetyltransferase [Thermoplasmata archaeon]